ncbi:large subunit ribosomal protein L24 [Frigoribacterium sp. CG_9.8]|nr:large subunit ribosomal protein L24 [Frigoribacterium sp. CG_9.8]
MANIKKGDLVQLISGRSQPRGGDRGKQGRVIEVLVEKNRVVVEGLNYITKHVRVGQSDRGTKTGGIETREAPIHVSNVQLVNPDTKQPARVGFTVETDATGKTTRTRYFKDSRRKPVKASAKKADSKKADSAQADNTEADTAEVVADVVVVTDGIVSGEESTTPVATEAAAPKVKAAPKAKAAPKTTKATEKDAD